MSSYAPRKRRGLRARAITALATAGLAAAAFAAPASAAPAAGDVALTFKKGADSSLLREGVKVTKAGGKSQTVKLTVAELSFGATTKLTTRGAITFRAGKSSATLTALEVSIGTKATTVSAKAGKQRKIFFRANGTPTLFGDSVSFRGPLALTGNGAKALRAKLDLPGITAGQVGSATASALIDGVLAPAPKPADPTPPEPKPDLDPFAAQCPLPANSVASPSAPPAGPELQLPGAPQITSGGKINWGFKQSFRTYLATAAEGSATGLNGASVLAPPPGPPQVGTFEFPVGGGMYEENDPGVASDDRAVIDGKGTIVMCAFHKGAGFRIALTNPTVTIDGNESRLTADVSTNVTGTITPPERVDLATIEVADPTYSSDPHRVKWTSLVTKLTQAGLDAMKLCSPGAPSCVYSAGMTIDPITVEIVEPWPLNQACTLASAAATATWPTVPASPAALPTLPDPVSAGDIDWGFRNSLRATVNSAGVFNLLGGATRSDPTSMAGAGKFFTWPSTTGTYEAGSPGRLVLQGTGTVGICNTTHGYGTVLANPTLVIDGANSRLTMDVATRLGVSWTSFRVDLVSLDIADVVVSTDPGPGVDEETITWTFPDPGEDDTESSVTLTEAGTKALWLLGASYRTAGLSLNKLSVSAVVESP